ncbi:hypothetical protein [Neobacillus cucumis]|uniref:hypothetical protein n=1 Tax=Neobacillus cucumis TaxID=1740721 RepID=UPI0019656DA4|nr:hypothetical protein [Neobacillus cucumis]MBM7652500.1 prefoldin subunit 5 [Neobacillus cucumis]
MYEEKSMLVKKIHNLEVEINKLNDEIRTLSGIGTGTNRILEAIQEQRWYFFKNKPKVLMDRDTGILWANLDYFKYAKENGEEYTGFQAENLLETTALDNFTGWRVPTALELWNMISDKSFPFIRGNNWRINSEDYWLVNYENRIQKKDLDQQGATNNIAIGSGCLLPCSSCLVPEDYVNHVSNKNKVYTKTERAQFTLNLFVGNGLEPNFFDSEITGLFRKIYIEKPSLIEELNYFENEIMSLQEEVLLSSSFDYLQILSKYDVPNIDFSVIKYHEAVISVLDELMERLSYYEEVKSEIIRDFNIISLKLSKKYAVNPNFTDEENELFKNRQAYVKRHFELSMNSTKDKLLAIKNQAEDIGVRIEGISSRMNALKELAVLEKEERASFSFIVEYAVSMIIKALKKIEFFEGNKIYASNIINNWEAWSGNYKTFKTKLMDDFKTACDDDGIESDTYNPWFNEWQKKRFTIEGRFLPLIDYSLKGNLTNITEEGLTEVDVILGLLEEYKEGLDKFYIEERKAIHTKCFFLVAGELQEKFEVESVLYALGYHFQKELKDIIFGLDRVEDRLFLLEWADSLLDLQVEEILNFVTDKEITKISLDVLTDFADLKRKNFDVYISDIKAYSEELQRREKEYNGLVFRMRKELVKQ